MIIFTTAFTASGILALAFDSMSAISPSAPPSASFMIFSASACAAFSDSFSSSRALATIPSSSSFAFFPASASLLPALHRTGTAPQPSLPPGSFRLSLLPFYSSMPPQPLGRMTAVTQIPMAGLMSFDGEKKYLIDIKLSNSQRPYFTIIISGLQYNRLVYTVPEAALSATCV